MSRKFASKIEKKRKKKQKEEKEKKENRKIVKWKSRKIEQ